MDQGGPEDLASKLEDLTALARVSTMVAAGTPQTGLAHALGPVVAALGDRMGTGGLDVAVVLPMVAGAVDRLRGYIAADKHTATDLAEALQLISGAVATPAPTTPAAATPTVPAGAAAADSDRDIVAAADSYGIDAWRSARLTMWLYAGGASLAALAFMAHWLLVLNEMPRPSTGDFLARSLPFLSVFALSAFVLVHANRQRRSTEELRRVERQLRTLPGYLTYLEPLPANTQALLRSALMQRLFPRLSEDDLLREPDSFPSTDFLMASITDEYGVADD